MEADQDLVSNFMAITGSHEDVAQHLLEMTNYDLAQAVVLYYDTDIAKTIASQAPAALGSVAADNAASGASASASSRRSGRQSRQRGIGHEDEDGVIHIDSDDDYDDDAGFDESFRAHRHQDDDEVQMTDAIHAQAVARTVQEEEDEAMAQRLQQEMYADTAETSDGIRAPMGRTTEVLVEPSYGGYEEYGEADLQAMMNRMRRSRPARGPQNPFSRIWDADLAGEDDPPSNPSTAPQSSRQARLADLFRPPFDLIDNVSWEEARTIGKAEKKWILANVQDMSDFRCQALNRDIWKDEAVKELVKESFIFLQYNKDDPMAESYIQYYLPGGEHENPDNYPHVAIIDPRTGEKVKDWPERPFPSALKFHAELAEFLDGYSLDNGKKNPVQRAKPREQRKDVGRMTEEEMLEMAMQNSLATAGGGGGEGGSGSSSSRSMVQDPDKLTTAQGGDAEASSADQEGKGKEKAEESAFARIASDHPHEEPANNPATTTRIQFRHPTGRLIRRFSLDDPVLRIYEWLKAEPLEGKAGVEFELKVAAQQAHDLIDDLDKTIGEAGLKQATVMVEFIES